jgi:hypothetical protein
MALQAELEGGGANKTRIDSAAAAAALKRQVSREDISTREGASGRQSQHAYADSSFAGLRSVY